MQTLSPSHSASITNWSSITVTLHRSNLSKGFQKNVVPNLVKMYRMSSKCFSVKAVFACLQLNYFIVFAVNFPSREQVSHIYIYMKELKDKNQEKTFHLLFVIFSSAPEDICVQKYFQRGQFFETPLTMDSSNLSRFMFEDPIKNSIEQH